MHRVRLSLPHFWEFEWQPEVLAVEPCQIERVRDLLLLETIPADVPVHRVNAFDVQWTSKFGVRAPSFRAWPFLYRAGANLIAEHCPDLVYFSTTAFPVLVLGRLWKRRFGVPFVVDLQDPWVGDYYDKRSPNERPAKHTLAQAMHRCLESFTMREVGGIIAVTDSYHVALRKRYPSIKSEMCRTIPFGASEKDFEVAARLDWQNRFFTRRDGLIHGVYVGVLGRPMIETCRAICRAIRAGLENEPTLFSRLRLHFVGTDYATPDRARPTMQPIAAENGLERFISEETTRLPYFSALRLLQDADFVLLLGSDNPQYTASKVYPYILARKPLLCVFHEESNVIPVMEETRAGRLVSFGRNDKHAEIAQKLLLPFSELLQSLPFSPSTDWKAFEPYQARELTRQQCELFDYVVVQNERP